MYAQVGFTPCPNEAPARCHRIVKKQRSLLSMSLSMRRSESAHSWSSSCEYSSCSDLSSPRSSVDAELGEQTQQWSEEEVDCQGVSIPYTKEARAKLDQAEKRGKQREEQLEMLHAVRQYMAERNYALPSGRSSSAAAAAAH